ELFGESEFVWRLPSVLAAAAMAAFIGIMTARWFDRIAGLTAGVACISLVALWSQSRSADIDSLNTFATIGTALCLIDLVWNPLSRPAIWIPIGGLFFGAALLIKLPACLPVVVGSIVCPMVLNRTLRPLRQPRVYAVPMIGWVVLMTW